MVIRIPFHVLTPWSNFHSLIPNFKFKLHRVECGGEFSVFINDNGIIMSCGQGDMGALGHGDLKDCLKPRLIEALLSHDVTAVSCGVDHIVTLTSDSCLFAWGAGGHGRLGTGSEENW